MPPEPGVVLSQVLARRSDWHLPHQDHGQRLEEQGEAAPLTRPGHLDLVSHVLLTADPRYPGVEVGLVLEEVQVAPPLVRRVVHRTFPGVTFGAREPSAPREPQVDVKTVLLGVELKAFDLPGRG